MPEIDSFTIRKMYEKAFHRTSTFIQISKLSGGFKNEVFLIEDRCQKVVLKVESQNIEKLITVDCNVMWWEVQMLQLMNCKRIPAPQFLFFDDSREVCSYPYFFMTYLPGHNYLFEKDNLTHQEMEQIDYQLGELAYQICSIRNESYFLPSFPDLIFSNNYEFILYLFQKLLFDVSRCNLKFDFDLSAKIYSILNNYQNSLMQVPYPCLSHSDMWEGNVLIRGNKVVGLIDFADMYYCDKLFTFPFHPVVGNLSPSFLNGFHHKKLNEVEHHRIEIYQLYTILKMMVDVNLKEQKVLDWIYDDFQTRFSRLSKMKKM